MLHHRKLSVSLFAILYGISALGGDGYGPDSPPQQTGQSPMSPQEQMLLQDLMHIKFGWNAVPLPLLSYKSDLGFQFGARVDVFDYGVTPSVYPNYNHKFHAEVSHYTQGKTLVNLEYDSSKLIPGVRLSTSVTWQNDPLCNFYGFNGLVTPYDRSLDKRDGVAYYCYKRNLLRFHSIFRGKILSSSEWIAGLSFYGFSGSNINHKSYSDRTLYADYVELGLIGPDENRGLQMEVKAGYEYDSRDFEFSPSRGVDFVACLICSPNLFSTSSYLKTMVCFSHYMPVIQDRLTFAFRLAAQNTLFGSTPYYLLPILNAFGLNQVYTEGLGGVFSVRGMLPSRLQGEGYAWGNFEFRLKLAEFNIMSEVCSIALNPFFDVGWITQTFHLDQFASIYGKDVEELDRLARRAHPATGMGLNFFSGKNVMLSIVGAKCFNNDNEPFAIYCTMNYAF